MTPTPGAVRNFVGVCIPLILLAFCCYGTCGEHQYSKFTWTYEIELIDGTTLVPIYTEDRPWWTDNSNAYGLSLWRDLGVCYKGKTYAPTAIKSLTLISTTKKEKK